MAKMKRKSLSEAAEEVRQEQGQPPEAAAPEEERPAPPPSEDLPEEPERVAPREREADGASTWSKVAAGVALAALAGIAYLIVSLANLSEEAATARAEAAAANAQTQAALAQVADADAEVSAERLEARALQTQVEALRRQNEQAQRALGLAALSDLTRDLRTAYYRAGGATGLAADSARALPDVLALRVGALADVFTPYPTRSTPPPEGACETLERDRPLSPELGHLLTALAENRFDVAGRPFRRAQFEGHALGAAGLAGVNLSSADLSSAALPGADLAGAQLTLADVHGADLAGAALADAALDEACLYRANLAGADLTGADLARADLTEAVLDSAVLDQANLCTAVGLTSEQLGAARSLDGTQMADSLAQALDAPDVVSCPELAE